MTVDPETKPKLQVYRVGEPTRTITLEGKRLIIGRRQDCAIRLDGTTVSARHARLTKSGQSYMVEDLKSLNGTTVNDHSIDSLGPILLNDGHTIKIGEFTLIYNGLSVKIDEATETTISASVDLQQQFVSINRLELNEALQGVLEVIKAVGPNLEQDRVLEDTLDALLSLFPQANRGFIYLGENRPTDPELIPNCQRVRDGRVRADESHRHYRISRTVLSRVFENSEAICSVDTANQPGLDGSSVFGQGVRSMICVPILDSDRDPIGMMQLDSEWAHPDHGFGPNDLEFMSALVGPISQAIENSLLHQRLLNVRILEQDAQNARGIQRALLPVDVPEVPGYSFWQYYRSAYHVGGDYFGYRAAPRRRGLGDGFEELAIAIADVSGKGMSAALIMAKLSAEVQVSLAAEADPANVLKRLNHCFLEADIPDSFITFGLAFLQPERHRVLLASAGHQSPLLRRRDATIDQLLDHPHDPPLGVDAGSSYRTVELELAPGDSIILFTDGIIEAMNARGQLFGQTRFRDSLMKAGHKPQHVGPDVLRRLRRFVGSSPQEDDITLLVFGRDEEERPLHVGQWI